MKRSMKHHWGNPSSGYRIGKKANKVLEQARTRVAKSINARPHEIYFTSCATESNNAILKSLSLQFYPKKKKIISTPIEHSSIIYTLEYLETQGIVVENCPVDSYGFVQPEVLSSMIDEDTFLVCCMLANNELGTVQNIKEISKIAKDKGVLILSDCVQALGKIPIDVRDLGVDYASFSAHKIYGPKGIGALYARITAPMIQFIHGGHQEEGLRGGTESIHNIAGFGTACQQIGILIQKTEEMVELKDYFEREVKAIYPDVVINSPVVNGVSNTLSLSFPGIQNNELMMMLDSNGIAVSSGSACSSQENKPSHVLKAIGLSDDVAQQTIRVSFGVDTTKKKLKYVLTVLEKYLKERASSSDVPQRNFEMEKFAR